jgi:hypothetical protein
MKPRSRVDDLPDVVPIAVAAQVLGIGINRARALAGVQIPVLPAEIAGRRLLVPKAGLRRKLEEWGRG